MVSWYLEGGVGGSVQLVERYRSAWLQLVRESGSFPPIPQFAALSGAAERGDGLRESDARQIDADIHRSRVASLNIADADVHMHRAALRRVLRAWCVLRPDVGYSQAMNFVAAVLLALAQHNEAEAFELFVALLHQLPADFYSERPPLRGFQVEVGALVGLAQDLLPELCAVSGGVVLEALPL